jgi:ATP-dependent Lon protease
MSHDESIPQSPAPGDVDVEDSAPVRTAVVPTPPAAEMASGDGQEQTIPDELPILPLRDTAAFPGTIMPLNIGREKSKRVVDHAMRGKRIIGAVAQRDKSADDPGWDDLYRTGTACLILKLLTLPDGTQSILVHGMTRFALESLVSTDPFLTAHIRRHEDATETSPEIEALVHNARQSAYRLFELSPNVPDEARIVLDNIDTAGGVADFLAANLPIDLEQRQELLDTFEVIPRLKKVNRYLAEQVQILELSDKIQSSVREEIGKTQREYYLQEQLKAIQKELGETDGRTAEIERLRERIDRSGMPEAARKETERELTRLERIPQASPEYSVALDYIEWMCDLPWARSTEDQLDLRRAERVLNEDHHGLEKVKQRILEFLAVRKLNPTGRGPILCFVGPPGVGKTSLGQSIARALGRRFIRISLGGLHDEAQLRGHRRTYIGAMPGRIVQELRKAESNNPVFMLDEVDKVGQDWRGDPASALLEILDPQQNHSFSDNYLNVPFDLSGVMFIATANTTDPIPGPLQDRMEIIRIAGYTTAEKQAIARRYLIPRQLEANGLSPQKLTIDDGALRRIISSYTREAGVRNLEREIGAIARAVAVRVAKGRGKPVKVGADQVTTYLGPQRFGEEVARRTSVPGVATGLAYTPAGGQILFIEASGMPGKGQLTLTGQIGEVMRESAQAAFSIARSQAEKFKIKPESLAESDLHVHVPAGAIPKDGPSAGVAMLTAIVSLFTGRPCRHDIAMTGEVTLSGRVLPIGGVKEKVLAAHRAGIGRVILPEENRKDLTDIPADVRKRLKFTFASDVEKVLRTALEPASKSGPGKRKKAARSRSRRGARGGKRPYSLPSRRGGGRRDARSVY